MRIEEKLKVTLVILLIIFVSLISFGGIYIQKMKFVENIIPEYQLGMDLEGGRIIGLEVDTTKKTVIYDKDGKVVEKEGKGTTKKEIPVNPEDTLTTENYNKVKEIIEKRLNAMNAQDYTIRQDEKTGKLYVQLLENSNADLLTQYMVIKGVFTAVNDDGDVLLNNSHIKEAKVGYSTVSSGTIIYLTIELNEEGTQIFKDITNTYRKTTGEDGKETIKKIAFKIDSAILESTYYESEISNGTIQIPIGSGTDNETIQSYAAQASEIAMILNNGNLPLTYTVSELEYVMSDITYEALLIPAIIIGAIVLIGIVFLIIKYKKNGVLSAISLIGYIATLLLVLRYANVMLTMEGIIGIIIAVVMEYIFTVYLLNLLKNQSNKTMTQVSQTFKEALIKTLFVFIPVAVTAVILCFAGWLPVYSFGMVVFWGLLLIVLYNLIITRTLIVDTKNK